MREALLDYRGMSAESNVPVRTLRTWVHQGKIPYIKTGHRSVFFQPSKVFAALEKFEIKAATNRR
jgi:excisionase family DNA binding protein